MVISVKFQNFNTEIGISVPYIALPANTIRLEVTIGWNAKAGLKLIAWNTKWGIYINPATHTEQSAMDVSDAYDDFHAFMEKKKIVFKNNTEITLLAGDYSSIYIHADAPHRSHVAIVGFSPNNQEIFTSHLVNRIFVNNPNPPHQTETNMPTDVKQIGSAIIRVPSGSPAPDRKTYVDRPAVGSTIFDIVSAPEEAGMDGYIINWYINNRGEKGIECEPLKFRII